jgi:hypothetical protein
MFRGIMSQNRNLDAKKRQLRRFVVFHWDMEEAKRFSKSLLGRLNEGPDIINKALMSGLIVAYSRPFSGNADGNIPESVTNGFDEKENKLHQKIVGPTGLRNTLYAHSDHTAHQLNICIADISGVKIAIPISHDPYSPLPEAELVLLPAMITKIQARLSEMQASLQEHFAPETLI